METMKFNVTKEHLLFRTIFFLHLSGPIEKIYTHNEMSYVLNLGLITSDYHLAYYSLPMFSLNFKISLISINMQMN